MTAVQRARNTLLRKHLTKEGALVQTSNLAKYYDRKVNDEGYLEPVKMSEGS